MGTTVEKLASNTPNANDISKKITDLQTTVKLLAPANIQTKNSVLELLSKEIECLLTLKKENPEKEALVLNKISKIKIPQTVEECTVCHGSGLPTGWTKHMSTSQKDRPYYVPSTGVSVWDRPEGSCDKCKGSGKIQY